MKHVSVISRNGNCSTVAIPRTTMETLGWKIGDAITLHVERGMLIITSLQREVERNTRSAAELAVTMEPRHTT